MNKEAAKRSQNMKKKKMEEKKRDEQKLQDYENSPIEDLLKRCELDRREVLEVLKSKAVGIDTVGKLESLKTHYNKIDLSFAVKDKILLEYVTFKKFEKNILFLTLFYFSLNLS